MVVPLINKHNLAVELKTSYDVRLRFILKAFRNPSAVSKTAIVLSPLDD